MNLFDSYAEIFEDFKTDLSNILSGSLFSRLFGGITSSPDKSKSFSYSLSNFLDDKFSTSDHGVADSNVETTTAKISVPSEPEAERLVSKHEMYDGAEIFNDISETLGVPIDQVNFLMSHIAAIFMGYFFRVLFPASRVGPFLRHLIQICLGVSINYFCFGSQMIHMFAQSLVTYLLMLTLRSAFMVKVTVLYIMLYLSICHLYRMVYDYGGYTLDITGPLMINTQKLTSLVFHIRDGKMDGSDLAPSSIKHALKRMPLPHEFLSYLFSFHSITCGPFCFYKDYIAFIDGSHFKDIPNPRRPPKPTIAIFRKLLLAAFFGFLTVFVAPYWPCTLLTDEKFAEESFLYKNFLLVFVSTLHRYKYYFAWILAEASNLSAGLGFNGYDANGHAKWDLIDNVVVLKTEFAVNMKQFIDNWNKSTTIWLRYLVYDRTGKTMMVFVISALWHGFYPGYYITFLSAGVFIIAARKIRKLLQPHFQVTKAMSILHDIVSCPVTGLSMCYIGFPFMLLLGKPVLYVYWHLYFYMHILVIIVLIFFKIVNVKPYQMKSY